MTDIVIVLILLVILGLAAWYVVRAKKRGQKCIGCPAGGCCPHRNDGSACSCGAEKNQ